MRLALALMVSLIASLLLGRLAIAGARRWRFLDHPGSRKVQAQPVPLLGGPAVFGGVLAAGLVFSADSILAGAAWGPTLSFGLRWFLGSTALIIVGLVDDRRGLAPWPRLAVQLAAALLVLPELSAWLTPSWLAAALGLLWVLGLINSLNFLDNMDAIAGSTSLWTSLALGLFFFWQGEAMLGAWACILAAALAGFLVWNRPPARLYLGDAGSTFLGYSLALFTLMAVLRGKLSPWLAPLLLAVPLYDTGSVFWIRWREGRPLWVGDLKHATHRMLARTGSVLRTLLGLNLWTLAAAMLAFAVHRFGRLQAPALIAALAAALLLFLWERRRAA